MKKWPLLIIAIIFCGLTAVNAQQKGKFDFAEETFDFGSIKEDNGAVEHKFLFTNTGDAPLVIQNVQASCGCTTPAWSKDPVPAGEKGFVTAKFDPRNRPGSFRKSLTITSNADQSSKVIYITGMVEQKPRTPADLYTHKIGNLRMKYQSLNMGNITTQKPFTRSFDLFNDSEAPITFLDKFEKPDYITIQLEPMVLPPMTQGKILITYNPKGKNDLGFVSDPVKIFTDESTDGAKPFRIVASIEEYFPPMTFEQLAQAPKLTFNEMNHDFGNLKKSAVVTTDFVLTNSGKSPLNIRFIKPNCGCTVATMEKMDIAPGESVTMKVEYDATGRRGTDQKSIVIFSNDPSAPTQRLTLKATIADAS
ncbi:MAG: DUF1573 domain-containing protein [Cyclobacteriaceae bacterium]|nr:DUF1573 domain-containing protein [Cyclobacteriaceae bacterium]